MKYYISQSVAQEIVETVKDICGCEVNYINIEGKVFASTDISRIGHYHEIGKKAAETGTILEAENDEDYWGTRKGVNIPVTYHKEICGVVGISGNPAEVRKYAELARRITRILLREQELEKQNYTRKTENSYIVHQLVNGASLSRDHLEDYLRSLGLSLKESYRTAVIHIRHGCESAGLASLEYELEQRFSGQKGLIFSYQYPNEYCLICQASQTESLKRQLDLITEKYSVFLQSGIGTAAQIDRQQTSYQAACLAAENSNAESKCVLFDTLDLEILLGSLKPEAIRQFLEKTISDLSEEERTLLRIYYENEMSLKKTGELLFLHKNTVQYKLDKITEKTSFHPRQFTSAVILYLALKLDTITSNSDNQSQLPYQRW